MANPATTLIARSPLADRQAYATDTLSIAERPLEGKVTLRGKPDNAAFMAGAAKALGTDLPTTPMSSVTVGSTRIFWRAFDEWMIWTAPGEETALIAALKDALSGVHAGIVDMTDYYTTIRVDGALSRKLLAKGCALDLHPKVFSEGQATGTGFHHATIFVARVQGDMFDVMIRWSFADYLYDYFIDGAKEWAQ